MAPQALVIVDMSGEGFCIELSDEVHQGEKVTLRMDRSNDMQGKICWALGNRAGGTFLGPVDVSVL